MSTDHNFWRERRAEADSSQCPSPYQPNALLLGQTGSQIKQTKICCFIVKPPLPPPPFPHSKWKIWPWHLITPTCRFLRKHCWSTSWWRRTGVGSTGRPHSADLRKCWHATPLSVSAFRPVYSRSNLDDYSVHLCRHFCCSLSWNSGYWLHIPHSMRFIDSQCATVFTTHFPRSEDLFIFFMYINISLVDDGIM